jgi:glycosyltransferase involved in cell wall biosynthesis
MKVAILVNNSIPKDGGSYTFEEQIMSAFLKLALKSHHEFILFSQKEKTINNLDELLPNNVTILKLHRNSIEKIFYKLYDYFIYLTKKISILLFDSYVFRLNNFFEKKILVNQIDVIWFLRPAYLTMEIPYIMTLWDLQHRLQPFFPEISTNGEWDNREIIYSKLLKRASFIITGTHQGKQEIEKFYDVDSERIKILPFPAPQFPNPNLSDEERLEKYKLPNKYLFYPAQFWPHKNHINLLRAIHLLHNQYDLNLSIVFVGSDKGNLKYIQRNVAELNLLEQVIFLGFIPQEDLAALYRKAFALVFVSFFGPDNIPPLEAFALGCPVIAAKVPGAEEQLGNAALLIEPQDEKNIAQAIKQLFEDQNLRATLIQRGLERAKQWTGEDYVRGIFQILDEFETVRRCWNSHAS